MHFLPIVTRELRVAARRKGTYRMRWWTALVAICFAFLFLGTSAFFNSPKVGSSLFNTLAFYLFALCLLAGVFITADSLSTEKREGTLGLLFLTDLKGYDVIFGKFMAAGLAPFYGLLSVFPIMALPLMLGGVTSGEFWRMVLALINALFFSLSLGLFVSIGQTDSQKTMGNTLGLMIVFGLITPLLEQFQSTKLQYLGFAAAISPSMPFLKAFENYYITGQYQFWFSLFTSHLLAWMFLFIASRRLPHSWQERPFESKIPTRFNNWTARGRDQNIGTRQRLLEQNPILWLMGGSNRFRSAVWLLAIFTLLINLGSQIFLFLTTGGDLAQASMMWTGWLTWPFLLVIKILIAIRASLFFAESRRNGTVELLLSTPLTNSEILRGQWLGLKRIFLWPILLIVIVQLAIILFWNLLSLTDDSSFLFFFFSGGVGFYGLIKFVLDVLAVIWLGLWMGLSCKTPARAPVWTILIGIFLPTVVFMVPDVIIDLVLIFWAKGKLEDNLRARLTDANSLPIGKEKVAFG